VRRTRAALVAVLLLLPLPGHAAPAPAPAGARTSAALSALLAEANPADPLTVFAHGSSTARVRAAVVTAGLAVVEPWEAVAVVVATGPAAAVRRLLDDPRVRYVEADVPVEHHLASAHTASRAADARDPASGLLDLGGLPFDGTGVTIAIPDTGIDAAHPMFLDADGRSKVVRNLRLACVALDGCGTWVDAPDRDATDGHGTHMAGIAAGFERTTGGGAVVRGVAPGARLVGLGAFPEATYSLYGHLSGLNWVLEHHADPCGDGSCPPIRVVSNAWGPIGDEAGAFDPDAAAVRLSDALVAEGVVVVFAVGNSETGGGDGTVDRTLSYAENPTPGVIAVANYDDGGTGSRDGQLAGSSNRGRRDDPTTYPDLAAPGTSILSACSPWQQRCSLRTHLDPWYEQLTGTSMAAPYVAGAVALLLQAHPSLTPGQVEAILEGTAHQFGPPTYVDDPRNPDHTTSFDRGHGLVDVAAALAAVLDREVPALPCTAAATIVDARGDATEVASGQPTSLAPSEPERDIVAARFSTDPVTGALTVEVHLAAVDPEPLAPGELVIVELTSDGVRYQVHMARRPDGTAAFHLQDDGSFLVRTVLAELEGVFDADAHVVRAVVPAEALTPDDPLRPGDVLRDLVVLTKRPIGDRSTAGPAFTGADTASTPCPHVVAGEDR
jgi:serine protease AprX